MPTDRFENYEILKNPDGSLFELGRGAMGVTYKAIDVDLHCDVALKIINPGIIGGQDAEERFLREARAAAKFRHPNIASVFRLGKTEDGKNFYAMEFCEGPTLEQAVAERGPFPADEAVRIVLQIAKALVLAEQYNLIHRDLKPANLILTESHGEGTVVKVIDFGLAKNFADGMQTISTLGTGGFAGTAHFASPEQLEESELDIRSDIFSLGVCLWFMLTGRPPFEGSLARVMSQMLSSDFPWEKLSAQPPAVVNLLRRMLAKDKNQRPESGALLRSEIDACLGGQPPTSTAELPPSPFGSPQNVDEFEARFHVEEEMDSAAIGRLFRASDRSRCGAWVSVCAIDTRLTAVPAVRREIIAQLTAAQAHPHGNLLTPLCFVSTEEGVFTACDWTEGFTLLELLRHRGALSPSDALAILSPLATAADHAVKHGLAGLNFSKEQIQIHFLNHQAKSGSARFLDEPLEDWPEYTVRAGTLCLDSGSASGGVLASMATIAPSSGSGSVISSAVSALANVTCELLGGRGGDLFAPLPRLSEAGNALLRRAFKEPSTFSSSTAFLGDLKAAVGASGGTSVAPRSTTLPLKQKLQSPVMVSAATRKKKAAALYAIVALILAGCGTGYYFGIQKPREDAREERNKKADESAKDLSKTGEPKLLPEMTTGMLEGPDPFMEPEAVFGQPLKPFVPDAEEWETLAATGDAFAQALLGERGVFRSSIPGKETEKGIAWISKSAEQKHPLGIFLLAEQAALKKENERSKGGQADLATENTMFDLAIKLGFEKTAETGGVAWRAALGRAYDKGLGVSTDSTKAIALLTSAAQEDHVFSQFMLGDIYLNERGVTADQRQAAKWYGRAAQAGFPAAQAALAWISLHGERSLRDESNAFKMASKAAKEGDVIGKMVLAECLEFGFGTQPSSREALKYYEEAADDGNSVAKGQLGRIHLQGKLVSEDSKMALRLLKESYDAGNKLVSGLLGSMYEDGKAGQKNIDKAISYYEEGAKAGDLYSKAALGICMQEGKGIPKDLKVAVTLLEEAAEGGISDAQYRLGVLLQRGERVAHDPERAANWLEAAANQKHPLAVYEWAQCLERGLGTLKKEAVALKLYAELAKLGFAQAAFRVGVMLEKGSGVPPDLKGAIEHYVLAANADDAAAQVNLGILYSQGKGVPQSDVKALEWYRKAAAKDDIDAWVLLGLMSEFGKGTARDPREAVIWYKKAADRGDEEAKTRLKKIRP